MFIRELFSFARLFRRFFIFICGKKVFPSGFLGSIGLGPEPVHKVKVGPKGRQGGWQASGQRGKKAVGLKFPDPCGKAGAPKQRHENKRAYDLRLVFSGPSEWGIETGKELHNRIQIEKPEFFADRAEFQPEPYALGRIKMYFCLMQEIQIFLMGLPVN